VNAAHQPASTAGDSVTLPADPMTHALRLANLGLAVLPVRADKTPARGWGVTRATRDPELIVEAFVTTGAPLVGVAMGASGLLAVDIDRHEGGADGFASLAAAGDEALLPATWSHTSTSGRGEHHLYAAPADAAPFVAFPGVDLKAGAGYVVWPAAAGVPASRDAFALAPAWSIRTRRDRERTATPEADVAAWIAERSGAPGEHLADALADLPEHGSARWSNPALLSLALPVVRAVERDGQGAPDARAAFVARYAEGHWADDAHRTAAARAFDRAVAVAVSEQVPSVPIVRFDGAEYVAGVDVVREAERIVEEAARERTAPESGRGRVRIQRASEITPMRAVWLWERRIPLGELTLLAGPGGLGKSTLLYDLAARITRGQLAGEFEGTPRSVLVSATEDSWECTIAPRLIAAGADLERVLRVEVGAESGGLTFPRDNDDLEGIARENDVALLILDPLLSRLGGKDTHKDAEVRQALEPVIEVAHRARFAVVGIMHLNKDTGAKRIIDRITASGAFVALARSVLVVLPDPSDDEERVRLVGVAKGNLTDVSAIPSFAFTIESAEVTLTDPWSDEPTIGRIGRIVAQGDRATTMQGAYDDSQRSEEDQSEQARCAAFIEDYLTKHGASASGDVQRAAQTFNPNWQERLCRRAAKSIPRLRSTGGGRNTVWTL
jgi:AAA domain/Bifunctional DNA primase/polymerase, N-terminal